MEEVREVVEGDGYAAGHIDAMGDEYGFRKVRRSLGVKHFGVNAIVMPPGVSAGVHYHDEQEEAYFVHSGKAEFEFGDGSKVLLGPGGVVRVDAHTPRRMGNVGDEDLVIYIVGAKDGYVGHDGRAPEGEERVRQA
jgi:mannose-6-phosphate isomerase-like protein (cupin superfamily)